MKWRYDLVFSYELPDEELFKTNVGIKLKNMGISMTIDFEDLDFHFGDKGSAYYYFNKSRKTPWDSNALEVTIYGSEQDIAKLNQIDQKILDSAVNKVIDPESGYILGDVSLLVKKTTSIVIPSDILQNKIREISTRSASFDHMPLDEQLEELNNVFENMLKQGKKYMNVDFDRLFLGIIQVKDNTDPIKSFRNETQMFRHASKQFIQERIAMPVDKKKALVQLGVFLATRVNDMIQNDVHECPF